MTFSGDLRGISLADIFQNVAANRSSGTLSVRWRNTERFVRFEEGAVAGFSLGVRKGLPIAEHLVQRGHVDADRLKKTIARGKRSAKSLGQMLVDAGLVTAEQVNSVISELVCESVYDLIKLRDADFAFTLGDPPPQVFDPDQRRARIRLDSGPLLVEGARRKDEWERIHRVVGSDRDLFVMVDGGDDVELTPLMEEVSQLLDGRTDVLRLLQEIPASRFEIMKAITELVLAAAARPCTADEIEENARGALDAGDSQEALRLLRHALELERSNADLRHEFAALLEELGHDQDAAGEHALLGFQAAREGDTQLALEHYDRAVLLNPSDPVLHEQRIALLRRDGDGDTLATAVLELASIWLSMGLADRARAMLSETVQQDGLDDHPEVMERLAEIDARLGRLDDAARLYLRLAERMAPRDETRAAAILRRGLQHCPDSEPIHERLQDFETGRHTRRLHRRRRLLAATAAAAVLLSLASAGVAELAASRQVVNALDDGLDSLREGDAAPAIHDLRSVQDTYAWTPSGHRAAVLLRRLVQMQARTATALATTGEFARAWAILRDLESVVGDSPLRVECDELAGRLTLEAAADEALAHVVAVSGETGEIPGATIDQMSDPRLLDSHLRRLTELDGAGLRLVLRGLLRIDSPHALAPIARRYLAAAEPHAVGLMEELLRRAPRYSSHGHEASWAEVYAELETLVDDPLRGPRARNALQTLRGGPAVPR